MLRDISSAFAKRMGDASGTSVRDTKIFHTLNGARGVAALAVMIRHAPQFFGFGLSSNYLAVDLFFALSGFVLAHAYEARFERGMGVSEFMRLRFIRLFPFLGFSIALTLIGIAIGWATGAHMGWTPESLAVCTAFNVLFLPAPLFSGSPLFPLDIPEWSLFLELFVNLLYVFSWRFLSTRGLIRVMGAAAIALIFCAVRFGDLTGGWDWATFVVGIARVLFSFPAGVLIYRLTQNWHSIRLNSWVPIAAMLLVFVINPKTSRVPFDLACVLIVLPVIVIAGALTRPTRSIGVFTFLGTTSYGVYAMHEPMIRIVNGVVAKLLGENVERFAPWLGIGLMAIMLITVWLLDKYFDAPVRRWLSSHNARPAPLIEKPSNIIPAVDLEGLHDEIQQ